MAILSAVTVNNAILPTKLTFSNIIILQKKEKKKKKRKRQFQTEDRLAYISCKTANVVYVTLPLRSARYMGKTSTHFKIHNSEHR